MVYDPDTTHLSSEIGFALPLSCCLLVCESKVHRGISHLTPKSSLDRPFTRGFNRAVFGTREAPSNGLELE